MSRLPATTGKDLVAALGRLGFEVVRVRGSHGSELQDAIVGGYREYLAKHDGIRPKAPASLHVSLSVSQVEPFENLWQTLLDALPNDV